MEVLNERQLEGLCPKQRKCMAQGREGVRRKVESTQPFNFVKMSWRFLRCLEEGQFCDSVDRRIDEWDIESWQSNVLVSHLTSEDRKEDLSTQPREGNGTFITPKNTCAYIWNTGLFSNNAFQSGNGVKSMDRRYILILRLLSSRPRKTKFVSVFLRLIKYLKQDWPRSLSELVHVDIHNPCNGLLLCAACLS